jgi:hypothetical protein
MLMSAHLLRLKLVMIYQTPKLMKKYYSQSKLDEDNLHLERPYWRRTVEHAALLVAQYKKYSRQRTYPLMEMKQIIAYTTVCFCVPMYILCLI